MKIRILTIALVAFSATLFGQSKLEIEAKELFWGANDAYKNATDIPDKWKNESAVVIYKNENYDFHKFGKNVTYKVSIRKRIKLLDKAAVEEFSEFSFKKRFRSNKGRYSWRAKGDNIVGVKIIKPDGKEIEINVDEEAVEVDGETKVAISNLEVGDIIDFYFFKVEPFKSTYAFGFDPVETVLSEEYPIMDFRLFFETENDFFINFNSYNGAPELKQIQTNKGNFRRYELVASDIEKNEFSRWSYPLVELPCYKFQVYFARSGKFEDRALAFLPKKESIIKKSVSQDEVLDLYDHRFKPDGDIGDLKHFLKGKSFKNDADKVTQAYYYMRHYYLTRFVEAFIADEADIVYPYYYYGTNPVFIQNEKQFVKHFTEFLRRHKIKYEIVVAKKRYDGSIDDLLIEKNVNVLLKVNTAEPLYVEFFGPHTSVNQYSPLIEGTDVFLLTKSKNKIDGIKRGKLPVSSHLDNVNKKDITVAFNEDFTVLDMTTSSSFKGHTKDEYQYEFLLFTDYINEDYAKYKTKTLADRIKNKKQKLKVTKEMNALIEKLKDKQKETLKEYAESDLERNEVEDYEFKIISTGRFGPDSELAFSDSFKAKNILVKKAGPNHIFEIGKLIGGQIDLEDKERTRTSNVHASYARTFNYNITMTIPEGYTVAGLDKLNKNVDNAAGAFISTATIEGDKLIVTTSKQYKNNFEPKENWPQMMAFLDAAFQFTNEKVLIKRK
ncbi:hypothetical protein [Pontimicrobium sp. IMCC45349]|uniref:hypothetical protein n=1 Tax=Pontimicrobium sp. IMCC45349 TaxID=3391574 RepID=UPI0039A07FAC